MRKLAPLAAVCGVLGLLAGCTTSSHTLSSPPPATPTRDQLAGTTVAPLPVASWAVEVTNPGFMMNSAGPPFVQATVLPVVVVPRAPEFMSAQPSAGHVWLDGYWTWRDGGYAWMAGHWELPPTAGAEWIAPRWTEFGRGYEFFEGYWE